MKMREYLFRGKSVGSGDWIEGYLNQHRGEKISDCYANDINSNDFYINDWVAKIDTGLYGLYHKVLPETIGQYTGLIDRNGKKIFEGDICKFKRFNNIHVGEIVFNATTASFVMRYQSIVGVYGEKATHKMLLSVCDDIEVIGNIHDNPEFLE